MLNLIKNLFKTNQYKKDYNVIEKRYNNKVVKMNPEIYFKACNAMHPSKIFPDEEIEHKLVGKKIKDEKGTVHTVKQAIKKWYGGYYIVLFLQSDHSSIINWQNINCICDTILESIESNNGRFTLVED
jgi:hypothetical protein